MPAEFDPLLYSPKERLYHSLYRALILICPAIEVELMRGRSTTHEIAKRLQDGRLGQRSAYVNETKEGVAEYCLLTAPLSKDKNLRGYNNAECMRLLAPHSIDVNDPKQVEQLKDGLVKKGPKNWALLLWRYQKVEDPENLAQGFLENPALVKMLRRILFGPRAGPQIGVTPIRLTKKARARTLRVRTVTVPMIAYVASLIHFALSNQPSFGCGGPGQFDYERFYQLIIREVEENWTKCERANLLSWWQRNTFGDNTEVWADDEGENAESGDDDESSTADLMRKQALKRRALAEQSINQ